MDASTVTTSALEFPDPFPIPVTVPIQPDAGNNAVDVPGITPTQSGVFDAVAGAMSRTVEGAASLGKRIVSGAATTITGAITGAGQAVGGAAAGALWPLVPIVVILIVGLGLALRVSGQKIRFG